MPWFWRQSAQIKILDGFIQQYLSRNTVEIFYPLHSERLLQISVMTQSNLELLERQLGYWFYAIVALPPKKLGKKSAFILLLACLHNVLYLMHPRCQQKPLLRRRCIHFLEAALELLPVATQRDDLIAYHAIFARFEPLLDMLPTSIRAMRWFENLVEKSPLSVLHYLDRLSDRPFVKLTLLFDDPEIARYSWLVLLEHERNFSARQLLKVREAFRLVSQLGLEASLLSSLKGVRKEFSSMRAGDF